MMTVPFPTYRSSVLIFLFSSVIFLNLIPDGHCAAAVQRRLQQQKAMQAQMVAQYQQQVMAQQQAQQVAAYQQAMVQRQAVMQQGVVQQAAQQKAAMEYAAYKQAMQQAVAQRNAELQAAEQVKAMIAQKQATEVAMVQQAVAQKQVGQIMQYKQAVAQKQMVEQRTQAELNQQIQQYADYMVKRQAAMQEQAAGVQQAQAGQQIAAYNQYQQVKAVQARSEVEAKMAAQQAQRAFDAQATQDAVGAKMAREIMEKKSADDRHQQTGSQPEEPQTIVDINDLWKSLDEGSEAWGQIIDAEIKVLTVAEYIDRFKKAGITIKKSPGFYVNWIEAIAKEDSGYLQAPFMTVLSYAAIMEYDFDNGQNKDELARRVLGEDNFRTNKARLELR